jgi:hypothetical protein
LKPVLYHSRVLESEYLKLWILDRHAGICIYEQVFEEKVLEAMSSDLVTGFFYAILTFSNEIAAQDIDHIMLKDIRIQFFSNDRLIFALATRKDADEQLAYQFLHGLEHRFSERYQVVLDHGHLNNTALFLDFGHDVEIELGRENTSISCLQTQPEKFKQYYETAKKNFIQFKETMIQGTKSIQGSKSCTSMSRIAMGPGATPKYVRLNDDRMANPGPKKNREDSRMDT